LIGACGTQNLVFDDPVDAAPDSAPDAAFTSPSGCASDRDCVLDGLHCDPSSGQCVACVTKDQCTEPGYGVCDFALNSCVECGADDDCGSGTCEPMTHRCIPSCSDAGTCPSGLFCDPGARVCIGCVSNGFCDSRSAPVCDPSIDQCVQCVDSADCPSDRHVCDRTMGRCVECVNAQNCHTGEVCDPTDRTCVDLRSAVPEAGPGPGPIQDGGQRQPI
jgi:hypothetical protein